MAKTTKKAAQPSKITHFFSKASMPTSSPKTTPSSTSTAQAPLAVRPGQPSQQPEMQSQRKATGKEAGSTATSQRKRSRTVESEKQLTLPPNNDDILPRQFLLPSTPTKGAKPVHLLSPLQIDHRPTKKARPSSPTEIIPSSQSDDEPTFPPSAAANPVTVAGSSTRYEDLAMDVDVVDETPYTSSFSSPGSDKDGDILMSTPTRESGTPDTEVALHSPIPTNSEERTAQIIANIKAKARETALAKSCSPPKTRINIDDISLSDSDEELLNWNQNARNKKGKEKEVMVVDPPSPVASGSHYGLRTRKTRTSTQVISPTIPEPKAPARRSYNPVAAMLKENTKAEKAGKGSAAIRAAEAIIATLDMANAQACPRTVDADGMLSSPSKPWLAPDESFQLDEDDERRLLGGQDDGMLSIIQKDKHTHSEDVAETFGVPLWSTVTRRDEDVFMAGPRIAVTPLHDVAEPVLKMLKEAIERGDVTLACLLLNSGSISGPILDHPETVMDLCNLALSDEDALTVAAFDFLMRYWKTSSPWMAGIPISCIVNTLTKLGAIPQVLQARGWAVYDQTEHSVDTAKREHVLFRLVALMTMSARTHRLAPSDVADAVLILILIGLDPSTSNDLQLDLISAVVAVTSCLDLGEGIDSQMESSVCTTILKFVATLSPVNRGYCVQLLNAGAGCSARLASWVAYGLILGYTTISKATYSEVPPLAPLIGELDKLQTGTFYIADDTNFVNMGHNTLIFGVAISAVEEYVVKELREPASSGDKPLQTLHKSLEALHNRIIDTRAAHLDRSRTKALIKALSMKVFYRRAVLIPRLTKKKKKTLETYFKA